MKMPENIKPLTSLIIEITNKCNLFCRICPVNNGLMQREKEHMEFSIFEKAIKNDLQLEKITLHNWGEPLLHPNVFEFIDLARKYHSKALITLSTNGTLLSPKISDALLSSQLDRIQFSIDGINKTYEDIRGFSYETLLNRIGQFLERNLSLVKENRKTIRVSMVINDQTKHDYLKFKEFWKDKVDIIRFQPLVEYNDLSKRELNQLCNWLTCKNYGQLVVLSNGNVVPCCVDYEGKLSLDNIKNLSITEIWHGDKLNSLRTKHFKGIFNELCANCVEFDSELVQKRF